MFKFDRHDLESLLDIGHSVELLITGSMKDGARFEATDVIAVIDPSRFVALEYPPDLPQFQDRRTIIL